MALFQNAVIKKHLHAQNKEKINEKWITYSSFFLDAARQERIRSLKEEQYQRGFLDDLFVKVLGYTLEPDANFNLSTEYKNVKDSKKADGAILFPMGHDPLEIKRNTTIPQLLHTIKINTPSNTKIEIELSKKLQDWYVLSYADFIKELAKKKVKLSLSEEAEWEDYFM